MLHVLHSWTLRPREFLTPIGIDDKHFLASLMLLFNVQWDIFKKQVPQAITQSLGGLINIKF